MHPATRLHILFTLALALAAPLRADDNSPESFYEAGKSRINKILDIFSSSKWLEGRGADVPTRSDPSQISQNGEKVEPDQKDKKAPEGAPDSGPPPRSGRARTTALWMPICFLFDPSHDPTTVNKNMKRLVDEYGRCGIAVEPFAFTVAPGYPQDIQQLNGLVRQACDFDRAFGVRGAIQMGVNTAQIPQTMCREPGAQGCSTLCERLSVSYLAPGAGPETAVHESLHSNCCGRLCVNAGEGTQGVGYNIDLVDNHALIRNWNQAEPADKPALADAKEEEQQLDQQACLSLRQGASPNDGTHRYDPNKLNFYARASEGAQKPLDGRSFFTAKSGKTPEAGHPAGGGGGAEEAGKRLGSVSFDDNAKKVASTGAPGVPGKPKEESAGGNDPRHKNGAGAGIDPMVQQLLGNVKGIEDDAGDAPENIQFTNSPKGVPSSGGSSGSARVMFDDNAKKGQGGSGGGQNLAGGGGMKSVTGVGEAGGMSGVSGSYGGASILGADGSTSSSLDDSFFDQIKPDQDQPSGERPRGSTLRSRELGSLKRESNSGISQRTDVLISSRPDPGRIAGEQKPAAAY